MAVNPAFANQPIFQTEMGFARGSEEAWRPIPDDAYVDRRQVGGTHYKDKAIQPWDAMEAWMSPKQFKGFLRGNVIRYMARCDDKGRIEDLKKAAHYLDKLIQLEEKREREEAI